MSQPHLNRDHRTGSLYGAFAFVSVILTCYAGYFVYYPRYYMPPAMVPVTFALGAIFAALGILSSSALDIRPSLAKTVLYYTTQCALLTAMVFLSPIRGFFGIIVLPLASQSIFDLKPRWATLVTFYLFAMNVALWVFDFGWRSGLEAVVSYSAGFAFTVVFTIITKRAVTARLHAERLQEELTAANEQLRESATRTEELATTRERNRLAREIHDGVGHYLTVVKTQLDAAAALIPTQPEQARSAVEKAAKLTHDALEDVRRSVGTLRTDTVRLPLADSLRQLAANAEPLPEIHVAGTPRELSASTEHALFRATQEALTNIRKHARATSASVTLDFSEPARVRLVVTDNGRGPAGERMHCGLDGSGSGYGLRGLRERVEIIGGKLETGAKAGGGFALSVEVPA